MSKKAFFLLLISVLFSCKNEKRYHDENELVYLSARDSTEVIRDILKFQLEMNRKFKDPEVSPLSEKQRKSFKNLQFFPPDSSYRVKAIFSRTPETLPFLMPTTTSRKSEYRKYGYAQFTLFGEKYTLNIYQSQQLMADVEYEDYLFLPFTDKTNGVETYIGGRYIDLSIPEGDSLIIDFNKAYNPYCAYNTKYSCPIVPKENDLNVEIRAGVKAFKK